MTHCLCGGDTSLTQDHTEVCNEVGVSFTEPARADGEGRGAGPVLREAARVPGLQIHAGGRRESHVWDLQVNIHQSSIKNLKTITK